MKLKLPPSLQKFIAKFRNLFGRFGFEVFLVLILVVLGFIVFEVRQFADPPRNEDLYNEQLTTISSGRFDKKVIDRAEGLIDSNVEVKQIYLDNRDNPFSEK